jgi:hypothetical protein
MGNPAKKYYKVNYDVIQGLLDYLETDPSFKEILKLGFKNFKNKFTDFLNTIYYKNNKENNNKSYMSDSDKKINKSQFDLFWKFYPNKNGSKGAAKTNWDKLCNKAANIKPTWVEIKKAVHYQSKSEQWQDLQFIPHASTWLNQQRWLDEPDKLITHKREDVNKPNKNRLGSRAFDDYVHTGKYPMGTEAD